MYPRPWRVTLMADFEVTRSQPSIPIFVSRTPSRWARPFREVAPWSPLESELTVCLILVAGSTRSTVCPLAMKAPCGIFIEVPALFNGGVVMPIVGKPPVSLPGPVAPVWAFRVCFTFLQLWGGRILV